MALRVPKVFEQEQGLCASHVVTEPLTEMNG